MLKKIRESLAFRTFIITIAVLLLVSLITFGLIIFATPKTYSSMFTDELSKSTNNLVSNLEQFSIKDDDKIFNSLDIFANKNRDIEIILSDARENEIYKVGSEYNGMFIASMYASLSDNYRELMMEEDESLKDNSNISREAKSFEERIYKEDVTVSSSENRDILNSKEENKIKNIKSEQDNHVTMAVGVNFLDSSKDFVITITSKLEAINPAISAIEKVLPLTFLIMIFISVVYAYIYSKYITDPILELSELSQKMSDLDFTYVYSGRRRDEVGILGENLNNLSNKLSTSLSEIKKTNESLKKDINRELEIKKERSEFFSAVSHELKTPVTILKGQLNGMIDEMGVYADREKYLVRSLMVTEKMENLIEEILSLSNMTNSSFKSEKSHINLSEILESMVNFYSDLINIKNLELIKLVEENLMVLGNKNMLKKAINNILSNAILYTPEKEKVIIKAYKKEEIVYLNVENFGVSLPEESIKSMFEPFYRVENSRNSQSGGSGLGLYITKIIFDNHNIEYKVENIKDGVRFTILFPTQKTQ